jgi:hypothetical protein
MNIDSMFPSRFLRASDLEDGPLTLEIKSCEEEEVGMAGDEKPVLRFKNEKRGLVLNRTNATILKAVFGHLTEDWEGELVTLVSTMVDFGGRRVAAIRIEEAHDEPEEEEVVRPRRRKLRRRI